VRHDGGRTGVQLPQHRGDAIRLTGQGIVALLRPRRGADAERLDDDGAVARGGELFQQMPEGVGRAEEARDQDDRLTLARHRHLE
jgi:hypothetical protein